MGANGNSVNAGQQSGVGQSAVYGRGGSAGGNDTFDVLGNADAELGDERQLDAADDDICAGAGEHHGTVGGGSGDRRAEQ